MFHQERTCWLRCSQTWWGRYFWSRQCINRRLIGGVECKGPKKKESSDVDQSTVIWYHSYDNEQCSCASHWLQTNSPERLTKPFDSFSLWHQRYPTAALHLSAVSGWCHWWWWEVVMPHEKSILPRCCLLTEDLPLRGAPADTPVSMAGGWLVQSVGTTFSPWLSNRSVLLLTPVLCHLRGTRITCRLVPLSPFHTNSSTRLLPLRLSLLGLLIHTVVCSHRTQGCRYVL